MCNEFNFKNVHLRDAAVLTNAYVAAAVINDCQQYNQAIIGIDFTIGSLTSLEVKVEYGADNTTPNLYQDSVSSVSGGITSVSTNLYTFTATGKFALRIPISTRFLKISFHGTGTLTNSSLAADLFLHRA